VIDGTAWPYVVLGTGYAAVALALMLTAGIRHAQVRSALRRGSFDELDDRPVTAFTLAGVLLAALTLAVVVAG
jgi:hypothetical protein